MVLISSTPSTTHICSCIALSAYNTHKVTNSYTGTGATSAQLKAQMQTFIIYTKKISCHSAIPMSAFTTHKNFWQKHGKHCSMAQQKLAVDV